METPWKLERSGYLLFVEPSVWAFESGRWSDVEQTLGVTLPADYRSLIGDGLSWWLDDHIHVTSPFEPESHLNLVNTAAQASWAVATLRQEWPDDYAVQLFPERGGLLCWGYDGDGNQYFWKTVGAPDRWPIVAMPRSDEGFLEFDLTLTGFISGLREGSLVLPFLDEDWSFRDAPFLQRVADAEQ